MASSTRNVKLGVCRAYFGGVDLGLTKGGVEATVTTETFKTEVDQFGKTTIKETIIGRMVSASVPMAETTIARMAQLMPGTTLVSDGARASGTITFATKPTATTTVTIGGQEFAFTAGTPIGNYQVKIAGTLEETLNNFISAVNRSLLQPLLGGISAVKSGLNNVVIRATEPGTAPNAITLAAALGATVSGATLTGGSTENVTRMDVTTGVGIDLLEIAQELRLHPISLPDTDFSEDFVLIKAATPGALQFAYKLDAERIFKADFMGYPDPVSGKLFSYGNLLA